MSEMTYTPVAYARTPLPSVASRHLANRFSYGWTPALQGQITDAGGPTAWFERQLQPGTIDDSFYSGSALWWPSINASAETLWQRHQSQTQMLWEAMADYQRWCLVRRLHSRRQVQEVLTDFWEHHLHVPAVGEAQAPFRIAYGKAIRARALGSFEALLQLAITHPAMGCYLGNAVSTLDHPNENLGRELLELHTVGRGTFTEQDVKNSARILTGWRVDTWRTWRVWYEPGAHWTGPLTVMGFTDRNLDPDGREVTRRYLSYLARHPATAQRIARKLAVRFVSDHPSSTLVNRLASVYLQSGTQIRPVLRALVASEEFTAAVGQKVRTPDEDVVATYRALGASVSRPTAEQSAAQALLWQTNDLGQTPFGWPRPDGRPDHGDAWSSTSRLLASFHVHWTMSGRWWPKLDVRYRTPASWLPQDPIRFDYLVDHLARTMTGRRSTATLLAACCQATGISAGTTITKGHALVTWRMPQLLTTILDQPAHMTR